MQLGVVCLHAPALTAACLLLALVLAWLPVWGTRARAQDAPPLVVLVALDGSRAPHDWEAELHAALARGGHVAQVATGDADLDEALVVESARLGSLDPARVDALTEIAALLDAARADAAALREGRALAQLARAAQIAEAHVDVAGSAAWNAEVQTAIGVVAAQAGLARVSADALARAATLDASRGVRAAEAPPDLVAQAAEIARRIATGPTGSFEVTADGPGARVFLDDADVGVAPRSVRAPVGRHVLRIEAPGHRPYGTMLDVFEGAAVPLHVTLDEDPLLVTGRALVAAARAGDDAAVGLAVRALALQGVPVASVWRVRAAAAGERALVDLRSVDGRSRHWGVVIGGLPVRIAGARDLDDAGAVVDADEAFLHPPHSVIVPPHGDDFWQGPWPWIVGGVIAAGAAAAIGVAAAPQAPMHPIVIIHQ